MTVTTLLLSGNRTRVELVTSGDSQWVVKSLLPFADVRPERRQLGREAWLSCMARRPGVASTLDEIPPGEELRAFRREYVDGKTLAEHLSSENPFSPDRALTVFTRLLKILADLHENVASGGLIHGDVTTTNVYLKRSGEVVLSDFGLARLAAEPSPASDELLRGARKYLAPELFREVPPSVKSDVYQAGRVLCELLAPGLGEGALERLPKPFRSLVATTLSHDPNVRPSASSLARKLG